jgi:SAM-dependent methyltransferase
MSYYDHIADAWHRTTGHRGGALKVNVLNDVLLAALPVLDGVRLLEVGAGNGYFMPRALRRRAGQRLDRLVITDASEKLVEIARTQFAIDGAEYLQLDLRSSLPFGDEAFDVVLATMVFNELTNATLTRALREGHRVLGDGGLLLATALHPDFVEDLHRRGELRGDARGRFTMPGAGGLRLPVVRRSRRQYLSLLETAGFDVEAKDVAADERTRRAKPGLRRAGDVPLALVMRAMKHGRGASPN